MNDLERMTEIELLQAHRLVIEELRRREVLTTRNNPVGDYTEWLVCRTMGLFKQRNSQSGFDAVDGDGIRYQIKGRQDEGSSVQFSAIRNLEGGEFDAVIAVVFNSDFSVRLAVLIPHAMVAKFARYYEHTNAHNLILTDKIVNEPGVTNIRREIEGHDSAMPSPRIDRQSRNQPTVRVASGPLTKPRVGAIPKSISIRANLIGRSVIRVFEIKGVRYEVPHDELVRIAAEVTPWLSSHSWQNEGGYSSSYPSVDFIAKLRPFSLDRT